MLLHWYKGQRILSTQLQVVEWIQFELEKITSHKEDKGLILFYCSITKTTVVCWNIIYNVYKIISFCAILYYLNMFMHIFFKCTGIIINNCDHLRTWLIVSDKLQNNIKGKLYFLVIKYFRHHSTNILVSEIYCLQVAFAIM